MTSPGVVLSQPPQAGGDQNGRTQGSARAFHHHGQQARLLEPPLEARRHKGKGAPDQQITAGEEPGGGESPSLFALAAADLGE